MTIHVQQAAKYVGEYTGWSKTNLGMQKIIYIANMLHLGEQASALVKSHFQAWDYGPVHPDLYHKAKIFGANTVKNIFRSYADLDDDMPEKETLHKTLNMVEGFTDSKLVAITHCEYGAWYKNYVPGKRYVIIPDSDILAEYQERVSRARNNAEN